MGVLVAERLIGCQLLWLGIDKEMPRCLFEQGHLVRDHCAIVHLVLGKGGRVGKVRRSQISLFYELVQADQQRVAGKGREAGIG